MSEERRQILEMLASGKISTQDAARLLDKLGQPGKTHQQSKQEPSGESKRKVNYLRIVVSDGDNDRVNIRLPVSLARTGLTLATMVPREVGQILHSQGIDLSYLKGLNPDELLNTLRDLNVDVEAPNGDKVRIFCE